MASRIIKKDILSKEIFKLAVENAFNHIIITDVDGNILYANKAVQRITHFNPKKIIGKNPKLWGRQMSKDFYKKLWNTIKVKKKPFAGEIINRRNHDGQYVAKAIISPILKNNRLIGFIGTEDDITREKEIDKMKSEFISIASHELRTPLTAIKGFLSMIFENDYGEINKGLKEPLKDIKNATERLIELVNNLLNISRIEAGRMKFTIVDFNLKDLIKEILDLLLPIAKSKKIKIVSQLKVNYKVAADIEKVREVMNNLIGNSLKFIDQGGITVYAERSRENKELLNIYVKDTGIGIAPEDQRLLFNKFQQISSTQRGRPQGSGLGLYISKSICRKMGGDLWLEESAVGKGSIFAFSLPISGTITSIKSKLAIKKEAEAHPDQK